MLGADENVERVWVEVIFINKCDFEFIFDVITCISESYHNVLKELTNIVFFGDEN